MANSLKKINKKIPLVIILGLVLVLLGVLFSYYDNTSGYGFFKQEITCDINIGNAVAIPFVNDGDLYIKEVNCVTEDKFFCSEYRLNIFNFGNPLPSDKGKITLGVEGRTVSKIVDITEGVGGKRELNLCASRDTSKGYVSIAQSNGVTDSDFFNF